MRSGNNKYKRLAEWLKKNKNESFTIDDAMRDTKLSRGCITVFIWRRIKKGLIEKKIDPLTKKISFKMLVDDIPLEISKGKLSEVVFEIIQELSQKSSASYIERWYLFLKVRKEIPNAKYDSVSAIIARWYRDGYLKKHPIKNSYRLMNPDMKGRPISKAK